jgi:chloramphenicol 3-O-phosphotransferase
VVGPCASGKSTLIEALREAGYDARHPAQEHSYVKDMWLRLVAPDLLIYLDISYEASRRRRPGQDLGEDGMAEQARRLRHARAHADLYLDTSEMTAEEVRAVVLVFLRPF